MTAIFCTDCYLTATMHADGTVACGCSCVADPDTDAIPAAWDTTREAVYALQLAESEEIDCWESPALMRRRR